MVKSGVKDFIYFLIKAAFIGALVGVLLFIILKACNLNTNYVHFFPSIIVMLIFYFKFRKK